MLGVGRHVARDAGQLVAIIREVAEDIALVHGVDIRSEEGPELVSGYAEPRQSVGDPLVVLGKPCVDISREIVRNIICEQLKPGNLSFRLLPFWP